MNESASCGDVRQMVTAAIDQLYPVAALRGLARHHGISEQAMLERLVQNELATLPKE